MGTIFSSLCVPQHSLADLRQLSSRVALALLKDSPAAPLPFALFAQAGQPSLPYTLAPAFPNTSHNMILCQSYHEKSLSVSVLCVYILYCWECCTASMEKVYCCKLIHSFMI